MRRALKWLAALAVILAVAFLLLRTPDTDPAAMLSKGLPRRIAGRHGWTPPAASPRALRDSERG